MGYYPLVAHMHDHSDGALATVQKQNKCHYNAKIRSIKNTTLVKVPVYSNKHVHTSHGGLTLP